MLDTILRQMSIIRMRRDIKKLGLNDPFQIVKNYKGFGQYKSILPKQIEYEINELYRNVEKINPKVICEIGTYRGGTLFMWPFAADNDALIISMDLQGGLGNMYSTGRQKFYTSFAQQKQELVCIAGDSHIEATKAKLKGILKGAKIDFLFIDGDHTYKGVKTDFELYSPLVRKGGIIAFHDILPREQKDIEVDLLWNEVKCKYKSKELIASQGQYNNTIGIGLIWK